MKLGISQNYLKGWAALRIYANQFHIYLTWVNTCLALCLNSVLNVKALEGAFNQEKALVANRGLLRDYKNRL